MSNVLAGLGSLSPGAASDLALKGLQILWINLLLSGDNAVVIALACRGLDGRRRAWAIFGGAGLAVGLRIVLTVFVVAMLGLPYVKLIGGALLLWIAFDLLRARDLAEVAAARSIWGAIRTIAVADIVMSLDNVVAVAAAAKNSVPLIVFGVALSVPLIVFGSTLILGAMRRFPILVVAGAVLLGWIAGGMVAADPLVARAISRSLTQGVLRGVLRGLAHGLAPAPFDPGLLAEVAGAVLVLAASLVLWLVRRHAKQSPVAGREDAKPGGQPGARLSP